MKQSNKIYKIRKIVDSKDQNVKAKSRERYSTLLSEEVKKSWYKLRRFYFCQTCTELLFAEIKIYLKDFIVCLLMGGKQSVDDLIKNIFDFLLHWRSKKELIYK